MFVYTRLRIHFGLYPFQVVDIECDTFSHVDSVFGLEQEQVGSEWVETPWHFCKGVCNRDEVYHLLSSSDHEVMYLFIGTVAEIGTAIVEDEYAFFKGFDGGKRTRAEDMSLDAGKDVVIAGSELVIGVEFVSVGIFIVPFGVIERNDQGPLSGHSEYMFEQRGLAGAVGSDNHYHFSCSCHDVPYISCKRLELACRMLP